MINKYLNKDIYVSPKGRQKIIDKLRVAQYHIMEYQKIINLFDNTPSQPTRFRAKIGLK